jgi:ribose transport system substrate-binding protein
VATDRETRAKETELTPRFRLFAVAALVATAIAAAACGSSDDSSGGSSKAAAAAPSSSSSGLSAEAQKAVDAAYKGSFASPPTTAPKPQAGKRIWVIMWSGQFTDLRARGQIGDAAKLMGWHLTLFDGKFSPDTWVNGIRQAIAAKADGIILFIIDCAPVKAALQDARKAGIPVVGWESVDCSQTISKRGVLRDTGAPGLFDATLAYTNPANPDKPLTYAEFITNLDATTQALGLIAGTEGKAKLIKLKETDLPVTLEADRGLDSALQRYCRGCQVVATVPFVGADIGPSLQQKVSQALAQHPEANAVYGVYDGATQSVAPAVMASGRKNDLFVMGGEGTAPVATLIREGRGVNAGAAYSVDWEGWAAMDAMNRLLNGEQPTGRGFPSGLGAQLYDKDRNLPPKGERYEPPIDFRAAYQKAWGG